MQRVAVRSVVWRHLAVTLGLGLAALAGGCSTGSLPSLPLPGAGPSAEMAPPHVGARERLALHRQRIQAMAGTAVTEPAPRQSARFELAVGGVSARGTTPQSVDGVSLTSTDPGDSGEGLPTWSGNRVTGWVRVNNHTGATMFATKARVTSVTGGATYDDSEWNYGSIAHGASSDWLPWVFTDDADHRFTFTIEVTWLAMNGMPRAAWVKDNGEGTWVYVSALDGAAAVPITAVPTTYYDSPALSADGTRMAMLRDTLMGLDVFVGSADGTGTWANVSNDDVNVEIDVWLSGDGTRVAWSAEDPYTNEGDIYRSDDAGFLVENVSSDPTSDDFWPSLSDDGSVVAWTKYDPTARTWQVYRYASATITNLSNSSSVADSSPVVSADGLKVVWQRYSGGDNEVMRWNNGSLTNISADAASSDETPSISADGTVIVWAKRAASGDYDVYAKVGSAAAVNISADPTRSDRHPSLSADGSSVVWQKLGVGVGGDSEVYAAALAGGVLNVSNDASGYDSVLAARGKGPR